MPNIIIGKFRKVDPEKELFLGHQFDKDGKRAIEKRCDYCGKWMFFDVRDVESWGDNVKLSFNGYPEKIHCGSSLCQDYHNRVMLHQKKENEKYSKLGERLFFELKKTGVLN